MDLDEAETDEEDWTKAIQIGDVRSIDKLEFAQLVENTMTRDEAFGITRDEALEVAKEYQIKVKDEDDAELPHAAGRHL